MRVDVAERRQPRHPVPVLCQQLLLGHPFALSPLEPLLKPALHPLVPVRKHLRVPHACIGIGRSRTHIMPCTICEWVDTLDATLTITVIHLLAIVRHNATPYAHQPRPAKPGGLALSLGSCQLLLLLPVYTLRTPCRPIHIPPHVVHKKLSCVHCYLDSKQWQ